MAIGSLDLAALAGRSPVDAARVVLDRIAAAGDDRVWISRVPDDALLARARALASVGPAGLPLYGVPFAVKDNIDVAGMATTAACPAFAYTPDRSAPCVALLEAAGAMLVGKTNLDQFATGMTGVRSPYGAPRNPFNARYVPGGSSSGSAVAVAAGLVSFALGTDTGGSARVPAGFNNIIGLKPTHGLISTVGVVPAASMLDCVSILALTAEDAHAVLRVAAQQVAPIARPSRFRFAVPRDDQREFFGDTDSEAAFARDIGLVNAIGGASAEIDFAPFLGASKLLFEGPYAVERYALIQPLLDADPDALLPIVRNILMRGGQRHDGDLALAAQRRAELQAATNGVWRDIDVMVVPTAPTAYTLDEIAADPVRRNTNLTYYTSFVNLLDLCAIAVPTGFRSNGVPLGVTLIAPARLEGLITALAADLQKLRRSAA